MGTTTTLDCASGKSLNVAGSDNTLTVTGTCATASIGGTSNKITFDKVEHPHHGAGSEQHHHL